MKKILAALTVLAFCAPSLVAAEKVVILGADRLVGFGAWQQVIGDKNPSDGCGSLGLKEFDPETTERIMARGCGIIMVGDIDTLIKDKNPKDGCGKIDLNFIMPKARDYVMANGCATLLQDDPWN